MTNDNIIICNGISTRMMIQYYVSWPIKWELYNHILTNKTMVIKGEDKEKAEDLSNGATINNLLAPTHEFQCTKS